MGKEQHIKNISKALNASENDAVTVARRDLLALLIAHNKLQKDLINTKAKLVGSVTSTHILTEQKQKIKHLEMLLSNKTRHHRRMTL